MRRRYITWKGQIDTGRHDYELTQLRAAAAIFLNLHVGRLRFEQKTSKWIFAYLRANRPYLAHLLLWAFFFTGSMNPENFLHIWRITVLRDKAKIALLIRNKKVNKLVNTLNYLRLKRLGAFFDRTRPLHVGRKRAALVRRLAAVYMCKFRGAFGAWAGWCAA
jgi:hypothetical protein